MATQMDAQERLKVERGALNDKHRELLKITRNDPIKVPWLHSMFFVHTLTPSPPPPGPPPGFMPPPIALLETKTLHPPIQRDHNKCQNQ